jgi:hypothetical protein
MATKLKSNDKYLFYIIQLDGQQVVWEDLHEITASRMYNATRIHAPSNILRFGWARMPYPTTITIEEEDDDN